MWLLYLVFAVSSLCHSSLENSCSAMKSGRESHAIYSWLSRGIPYSSNPNFLGVSGGPG